MWTPALGALAEGHRAVPKWWLGPKTVPPGRRFLKLFISSTWPVLLWLALMVLATLPFYLPSLTLAPFRHPLYPAEVAAALWMARRRFCRSGWPFWEPSARNTAGAAT
jgi:hypothetical protein